MAVNPAGTHVYVANNNSNTVSVIDTANNTVTATVAVGGSPHGVAVSPNETRVYVANGGSGTVSVIDTTNNSVVATVTVGSAPYGVAVNPAGTHVYVTNSNSNTVSVIDTTNNNVIDTVTVGSTPRGVAVNHDGTRVYVTNQTNNSVSVIDTTNNNLIDTVTVGNTPFGVAVNHDGTRVYVANYSSANVSVIDTASNSVTTTVAVGNHPFGVAVNPDGTHVYVVNQGSGTVSVIDTASNNVIHTVAVGSTPASLGQFIGEPPDTTPDAFSFTARFGVNPGAVVESNAITVTGLDSAAPISITGGSYSINDGAYTTTTGAVNNNDTVTVRQTASASYGATTTVTLTIGGVSGAFDVTTLAADTTPDAFSFTARFGVNLGAIVESNTITVSGINTASAISIVGGSYSINGGAYTTDPGTVSNGNTVSVRQASSSTYATQTIATLTIGGVSGAFHVVTAAPNTTPAPFSFTPLFGLTVGAVVESNPITISGLDSAAPISIMGGSYSINGDAYTTTTGTVNNNETVTVRQTASGNYSTLTTATLTIGSFSDVFQVTTAAPDTTPGAFSFAARFGVNPSAVVDSNAITVTDLDSTAPISITGGSYSINGGAYTTTTGTVNNNDTVTVRQTASASYGATTTATLTIGSFSDVFQVTTLKLAVSSIVVDPAAPAILYTGLDGAGVYKSSDSGGTWNPATTQPGNTRLKALLIKPGDSTVLFAATYGGGVFQSSDSGVNWSACATQPGNLNLLSLTIDAAGMLYAGSEAGVFVSNDSCASWTAMNAGLPL